MNGNDQPEQKANASPSDVEVASPPVSELAGRILRRYGEPPGVIGTGDALRIASRLSRTSTSRLPLLADIQRRWAPAEPCLSPDRSGLPYARPPIFAGALPQPGDVVPPAPTASSGTASSTRLVVSRHPASSPAPEGAPQTGREASSAQGSLGPKAASRSVTADLGSASVQRHLAGQVGRETGEAQGPAGSGVASSKAAGEFASGSVGRALAGPVIQRQVISPRPAPPLVTASLPQVTRPAGSPGQPGAGAAERSSQIPAMEGISTGTLHLGEAIVRRHLAGPAGRVIQRQVASPGPGQSGDYVKTSLYRSAQSPSSPVQGMPAPQPGTREAARSSQALAGASISTGSIGDLGGTILRRHLAGPAWRAVQRKEEGGSISTVPQPTIQAASSAEAPTALSYPSPGEYAHASSPGDPSRNGTSAGANTPLPLVISPTLGSGPVIARQVTTPADAGGEPGMPDSAETMAPAVPAAPAGRVDLGELAERVSRLIFRQLAVERERRGIGRWN